MKVTITYTKVVTEDFEVPDNLPKMEKEEFLGNYYNALINMQEVVDFITEQTPEIRNNVHWEPAGIVDTILIPELDCEEYNVWNVRFGGKW